MCVMLPARVLRVTGIQAEVEMGDGQRTTANAINCPDLAAGEHVLIDRGLIVERIDAAEAEMLMAMYGDIEQMLAEATLREATRDD